VTVLEPLVLLLLAVRGLVRARQDLVSENVLLRHQLAVLTRPTRTRPRPRLRTWDKVLWVLARRFCAVWRTHLVLVTPDTVLRWSSELPAIILGGVLLAVSHVAAPVAFGPPLVVVPLLATAGAVSNFGLVLWLVNSTSLTQQIVSPHALGRVAATQQTVVLATVPIGALIGGLLAEAAGPRLVVGLAAVGTIGSMLSLVVSPIPALRDVSQGADGDDVRVMSR